MPTSTASSARRLAATAYHEAGHAVMAIQTDRAVRRVTIVPDEEALGTCHHTAAPTWLSPDVHLGRREIHWLERAILILLAGPAAEARFTGRRNQPGARHDYDTLIDLATYIHCRGPVLDAYLAYLQARADEWTNERLAWRAVEAVAAGLLAKKTLTGREARVKCRGVFTPPPLSAETMRSIGRSERTENAEGVAEFLAAVGKR